MNIFTIKSGGDNFLCLDFNKIPTHRGKSAEKGKEKEWVYGSMLDSRIIGIYDAKNNTVSTCPVRDDIQVFTNFFDRFEKPIYEGDILKRNKRIYVVEKTKDTMQVAFKVNFLGSYLTVCEPISYLCNKGGVENIGNIYDTPELIP